MAVAQLVIPRCQYWVFLPPEVGWVASRRYILLDIALWRRAPEA